MSEQTTSNQPGPTRIGEPRRVLVVEDVYLIACTVEAALRDAGCRVIGPAATLEKAEQLLAEHEVDAAVLNFQLSTHNTAPLARRLVARGCPILFVSGNRGQSDVPADLRRLPWLDKIEFGTKLTSALRQLLHTPSGLASPDDATLAPGSSFRSP